MYHDNDFSFFALISRKIELGRQANALAHMVVGMMAKYHQHQTMEFADYLDSNGKLVSTISRFPFIVLSANNSSSIAKAYEACKVLGTPVNVFVGEMIGASHEQQLDQVHAKPTEGLDYWGLVVFGRKEDLTPIMKKFSMYRGQAAATAAQPDVVVNVD